MNSLHNSTDKTNNSMSELEALRAENENLKIEKTEFKDKIKKTIDSILAVKGKLNGIDEGLSYLTLMANRYKKIKLLQPSDFTLIKEKCDQHAIHFDCVIDRLNAKADNLNYAIQAAKQDSAAKPSELREKAIKRLRLVK